ncbi:hypothetical protein ABIB25_000641 [Nakamurella sp. UYEF19]|uniref:hypothetical protein n=1 Tax=Nakamurella sp. UYEF19 TaxID=1756392 RepID=UPI0033942598
MSHGDGWTCYLNNAIDGGDPASALGHMSRELGCLVVVSTHQPRTQVGHAATQFELIGPGGEPPLNYMRTISAHAGDGRWQWYESGEPRPFEDLGRYRARLVRDRFPRPLLLEYLSAMDIEPDDRDRFGQAILIKQHVSWPRRQQTLAEARRYWSLA